MRVLSRENSKLIVEVIPYDGKSDTNAILDWISKMEKFFKYENTPNDRKVKTAVTRLKGNTSLKWENLQTDKKRRG